MKNNLHVMLIDDSKSGRLLFGEILTEVNETIRYTPVEGSIEALQHLNSMESLPDFIFLDIHLPKIDGYECYAELKKIERIKDIPVYFYSSTVSPGELERIQQMDAKLLMQASQFEECVENITRILEAA
jgi:CheY-like chemotaxis protein